ncbi:MAG: hypothetical protein K2N35_02430 [Muribaculaceae bacterium]|nr:hypothetical protein [Muribaculaceae bacterium]
MKKLLFLFAFVFGMITIAHAQVKETFDSNSWQWTEYSADMGRAYIIEGVMRLESKSDNYNNTSLADMVGSVATHSFLPMDPAKGFDLKCTATLEKFEGKKMFGIILDYVDDMNCLVFMIKGDCAWLYKMKEGKIVGQQKNQFKLQKGKKSTNLDIQVIYQGGELEFRVNDVQALMCKYVPITSNGFGFFAFGKCKVDFDDVEIMN